MRTIEFNEDVSIAQIIAALRTIPEKDIKIVVPKNSIFFTNSVNQEILKKLSADLGKSILFSQSSNLGFVEGTDVMEAAAQTESIQPKPQKIPSKPIKNFLRAANFVKMLPKKILIRYLLLVAVLLLLFLGYYFIPSVTLNLKVESRIQEDEATFSASPRIREVDFEQGIIPLESIETLKEGSLKTQTSGKKIIGDSAKGNALIRNYSTAVEKIFSAGTKLKVSSGKSEGLEFSLTKTTTVPVGSASATIDAGGRKVSVVDPGRAETELVATKVGAEGNIDANSRFSVGSESLDTIDAINTTSFEGGTSKEIKVVSEDDQKNLLATLSAQLYDEGEKDLRSETSQEKKMPQDGFKNSIVKKSYDKSIDSEAEEITLNLSIKTQGVVYSEKNLFELMKKYLEPFIPEGFLISEESKVEAEVIKRNEDNTITFVGKIQGVLLPKIDVDNLKKTLRGKSLSFAHNYLGSIQSIKSFDIKPFPVVPAPLARVPFRTSKINIEIKTQ